MDNLRPAQQTGKDLQRIPRVRDLDQAKDLCDRVIRAELH